MFHVHDLYYAHYRDIWCIVALLKPLEKVETERLLLPDSKIEEIMCISCVNSTYDQLQEQLRTAQFAQLTESDLNVFKHYLNALSGVNVKLTNGLEKMLALNIIMKEKFQLDQLLEVQNLEAKLQDQRSMFRSKISSIDRVSTGPYFFLNSLRSHI